MNPVPADSPEAVAFLEGLVRSAGVAIVGLDTDGQILRWNDAATRMFGYAAAEVVGRRITSLYSDGRSGEWEALSAWVIRGQRVEAFETTWLRKDGAPVPLALSLSPIVGDTGEILGLAALAQDLTVRRRLEQELGFAGRVSRILASHAEVDRAFEAVAVEMASLIPTDQSVLLAFDAERQRLSWLASESTGSEDPAPLEAFPPAPRMLRVLQERLPRLLSLVGEEGTFEATLAGMGCVEALWYPLQFQDRVVGLLSLATKSEGSLSLRHLEVLRPIILPLAVALENQHLLRAVSQSERKYRDLYDHAPDMLLSIGPDLSILDCNATMSSLLGYPRDELVGASVSKLHGPGFDVRFRAAFAQLVREGYQDGLEGAYRRKDGSTLFVSISSTAIYDDRGAYVGSRSVVRDVTERKQLQRQVVEAAKLAAVGQLAAGVAHELNNPLAGVVGFAQLLLERGLDDDYVQDRVEKILESGDRCRRIVQDLLLYARSKGSANPEPIDLDELVARVVRLGEYQWRIANVTISRERDPAVSMVEADPDLMEQVFLNLITNAVDAMEDGGHLSIEMYPSDLRNPPRGAVDIAFKDEGPGIHPTVLPRIFEPFFTTKEVGKGTGLGLSIAYSMVKEHGGDILAETRPEGGAMFVVRVPVKRSAVSTGARASTH